MVKRRLPVIGWIRRYTKKDFISDMIAGVTVGLTVVPQSMAYAAIAGLSPEVKEFGVNLHPKIHIHHHFAIVECELLDAKV